MRRHSQVLCTNCHASKVYGVRHMQPNSDPCCAHCVVLVTTLACCIVAQVRPLDQPEGPYTELNCNQVYSQTPTRGGMFRLTCDDPSRVKSFHLAVILYIWVLHKRAIVLLYASYKHYIPQ